MLLLFLSLAEFSKLAQTTRTGGGNLAVCGCPQRTYSNSLTIPNSYDLRTGYPGTLSPIRNQGECGCCWAFSTTSVLADRFAIAAQKQNRTIRRLLSPQTMLDCSTGCLNGGQCNMGCNGGYNTLAIEFFNTTGVVGENCRPYAAAQQVCPAAACAAGVSSQRYHSSMCYSLGTVADMQRDIMTHGSIVAGLQIFEGFESYTSGVYTVTSSRTKGGHAVRLIGWGEDKGVPYWIGANQWTTWWGEQGYFRIRRGTSEASIEDFVIAMEPSLNLLTQDENVDYMSTCADCVTRRQAPNSDPLDNFLPDIGIEWPGGISDTTAISLIALGACALLGCLATVYYCIKPKRKHQNNEEDSELHRALEESKREQQRQSVAAAALRDRELELAIALSQIPANSNNLNNNRLSDAQMADAYPPIVDASQPHRVSNAPQPHLVSAPSQPHRMSASPQPQRIPTPSAPLYSVPVIVAPVIELGRVRAASRLPPNQGDAELKQALALSQQNAQLEARRMTREEADIQLALQLSQAEAAPPAYSPKREEDDLEFALALSRGDRLHGVEG